MNSNGETQTEENSLYYETSSSSVSTEPIDNEQYLEPDIEVMCHIRDILDSGFPEENKGDPSFKIVHKHVVEYIARNCNHVFIMDWVDTDPDKGGVRIEYCELCLTLKKT